MSNLLEIGDNDAAFLRRKRRPSDPSGRGQVALVDLFSGCGGLSLGLLEACRSLQLGLEVRLAVERSQAIAPVYRANFQVANWVGASDVAQSFDGRIGQKPTAGERTLKRRVGPVDMLVGGPPCQGHSTLNNHTRGDDPKNALYLAMVRAAEVLEPEWLLVENVPALERDATGVLAAAQQRLDRLGYEHDTAVVSLVTLGVPQLRHRHVLLASRSSTPSIADALRPAQGGFVRDLEWAIGDLLDVPPASMLDTPSVLSRENLERARWLIRRNEFDLENARRPACHRDKPDHKYKSMYGRLRWNEPAQTITTGFGSPGQGRYFHPSRLRTLTPHEAARLQFFPDWFDFSPAPTRTALAEAIGNAVPPKLGFVLATYALASSARAVTRSSPPRLPRAGLGAGLAPR